jgi:hypothetical protein
MGIFDTVCHNAWQTKLRGELALVDREIGRKECAFGVAFYDTIKAYIEETRKSLPSMCDFIANDFLKVERAIRLLEDEKEVRSLNILINRSTATNGPPENTISDSANEAMIRSQIHGLDRDIAKRKEEFGSSVSREVAEKARFWSSWGVSAGKANDVIAIRKLMEKHSADLLPMYNDRDNRMRTLQDSEGPVVASPAPKAWPKFVKEQVEFESLTRLEQYLERNKTGLPKAKSQVINKGKAESVERSKDSSSFVSKPNLPETKSPQRMTKPSTTSRPVKENPIADTPQHGTEQAPHIASKESVPTRSSSSVLGEPSMKSAKHASIFRVFASNAKSRGKAEVTTTKSATENQPKPETAKPVNKSMPVGDKKDKTEVLVQRKTVATKVEDKRATVSPKVTTTTHPMVIPTNTPSTVPRRRTGTKVSSSSSKSASQSKVPKKPVERVRVEL